MVPDTVIPVAEISEAVALRKSYPDILLAGEREGLRIQGNLTGGIEFNLGNSPREFTPEAIRGKKIAISTTNGSRALRACLAAKAVLIGSFLNLSATANFLKKQQAGRLSLVCSGTGEQAAYEDVLGAGALLDLLWPDYPKPQITDSAHMARQIYQQHAGDLMSAVQHSRNGCRLLGIPELRDDVACCLHRDTLQLVAKMDKEGRVKATVG